MGETAAEAYAASTTWYYDQTDLAVSFTRREVAQLVEHRSDTPLTLVRFPGFGKGFFFPGVNFQCRFSYGVCTYPREIACINFCVHVRDPVVRVRVRWITEALKHSSCTVDWVARLCHSWLSQGKATRISHWRKFRWANTVVKSKK